MHLLLATGGCGFLGSNLIRRMLKRRNVSILNLDSLTCAGCVNNLADLANHPRYCFFRGDVTDPDAVRPGYQRNVRWVHAVCTGEYRRYCRQQYDPALRA